MQSLRVLLLALSFVCLCVDSTRKTHAADPAERCLVDLRRQLRSTISNCSTSMAPKPHGSPNLQIQGLIFRNAFSNAPVCSVARTTLMTGCYAPRIGTQFHRRSVVVPMPAGIKMFPAYLRESGYYTTNRNKKDYKRAGNTRHVE